MLIKNTLSSQNYSSDTKQESSGSIEKLFHSLITEEGEFDLEFDEDELKNLSFEEVKELKIRLEESGYLKKLEEDEQTSTIGSGLLKVITFTYDEEFNKSLFDTTKEKEDPKDFVGKITHNIEHFQGNKEYLWPNDSKEDTIQNSSSLARDDAIKSVDAQDFLTSTIKGYEKLLSTDDSNYKQEDIKKSLHDLKEIQNGYNTIESEKSVLLTSILKVNRENPLLSIS